MDYKLHLKGWSKKEITHAKSIFAKAEKKKHRHVAWLESSLFYFTIATGVIGNFVLSFVLIPILMMANGSTVYIVTSTLGLLLGTLVFGVVRHMRWLASHHHLFIALLIPLTGIFNFFFVVSRVNQVSLSIGLNNVHDPWLIGVTYFVSFSLPYGLLIWKRRV